MAQGPPQCLNRVSQWLKYSYTPFYKPTTYFYKQTAHFHIFLEACFALMQQIRSGKSSCKMGQNGSRPPQCFNGVSQWFKSSYTPFYKQTTHFYKPIPHLTQFLGQFLLPNAANSKREKQLQNGTKWLDLIPQGI